MAQKALDAVNFQLKKNIETQTDKKQKNVETQTGIEQEFFVTLSKSKHARLYFSKHHNDLVLSFNINQCKSFIINRNMWKIFRNHIIHIDKILFKND